MIRTTPLLLAIGVILCPSSFADGQSPTKAIVFRRVTVVDVAAHDIGRALKPNQTVVISGNRGLAVDTTVDAPDGAQIVEGRGRYLIPGLWDMHAHADDRGYLPLFVANGVTGIRDMAGIPSQIKQFREEISKRVLIGPFIAATGYLVDGPKPIWPDSIAGPHIRRKGS